MPISCSNKSLDGAFDEESYAKAKPHFENIWAESKAAGYSIKEFSVRMLKLFGAAIKPRLSRFLEDKLAEGENAPTTESNAPDSDYESLEVAEKSDGKKTLTNNVYEEYTPSVTLPGAKGHPGVLVESAALASVQSPETDYVPILHVERPTDFSQG